MDPRKDKELNQIKDTASDLVTELYDLMESGTTIDFMLPHRQGATAGKRTKPVHLIVTKPRKYRTFVTKPNETDGFSPPVRLRRRK